MLDKSLSLGLRLQIIRKQKGMSQKRLAELTGIHQNQISKYEKDINAPSLFTLDLLCTVLGVTATQLLGY